MDGLDEDRLAFAEELEEVALQLSMQDPATALDQRLAQVASEYERLTLAAEMFGYGDVAELTRWASSSLSSVQAEPLVDEGHYFTWLELTALTFREPEEIAHLPLLIAALSDPCWPEPLPAEQLQHFLLSLRPASIEEEDAAPAEQANGDAIAGDNAQGDDTLSFAADVHPELLAAFMEETPGHISEAARLIRLIAIGANSREQRQQAARLAHTLKGSSSVVRVRPITTFTHRLEGLLAYPLQPMPEGLGPTLEAAADCLESLFENVQNQQGLPAEYAGLQTALTEWLTQLAADAETDTDDALTVAAELSDLQLPDFLQGIAVDPAVADSDVNTPTSAVVAPVNERRIQELLHLAGELITSSSQTAELLQRSRSLSAQLYQQDEQIRQRLDELESSLEQQRREQNRYTSLAHKREGGMTPAMTGRPDLDALQLESYSDLYSVTSLLNEAAADSREMAVELQGQIRRLSDELYQQQRVQRRLSEAVLGLRMTAVSTLVPRLERIVRETCRHTGKQAELQVQGQELQCDSDILKGLTDPLLHLLRNAVDHGIEMPEQRSAVGKAASGQIRLTVSQQGRHIQMALSDDGAGMSLEHIRTRALQRGLIREDQPVTDEALLRLVLTPGFSTREEVSEVSGRGVGMDVVNSAVQRLRGTLKLDSAAGQGTTVSLRLPQTLIATHALIVVVSGQQLAIPSDSIEQILYVSAEDQHHDAAGWRIETERYQLPVLPLADLLHWQGSSPAPGSPQTLLIVRGDSRHHALFAEAVLPSRDIVINSLSPWLHTIPSVQGACILADGAVAPVLDIQRLLLDLETGALLPRVVKGEAEIDHKTAIRSVLVVDDSLSNRKLMRLMLEGMNYRVHTAVDGMDALKLLNETPVELVLSDLEMPRMNGLELTQALRIWPEMKHLPVVMVTSRGTDKHRKLAAEAGVDGYLTKPVQAPALAQELDKWLGTTMSLTAEKVPHGER